MKASNSWDGKYGEYLRKGMRNSTHIVVPLGVSETKQGLLQDRYSPSRDAALDVGRRAQAPISPMRALSRRTDLSSAPPRARAGLGKKVAIFARLSLGEEIRSISGTPTWLMFFLDRLMDLRPEHLRRIQAFYPKLELIAHGGVGFAPYRHRFEELLEGSRVSSGKSIPRAKASSRSPMSRRTPACA